ncbi:reverse transcriptase domain-containing protein [Tanacetum coccineum]|uniref:Reverse transcriptase domain-containing protein n=1 Tax=Tanacetum coccineum TaxID=301880 RepID=A0ABQ5IH32_9ASTR
MLNPCGLLTVLSHISDWCSPGSAISIPETANEFAIKGNHLTLIKGNQFDGGTKTNPHKHIHEFLVIRDMFKYRDIENEAVRLMMFPLSLTAKAKTWLDELNEGTIETWDELRTAFISRFFPPSSFRPTPQRNPSFSLTENESLTDAWLRMKEMLQNCHGHNLSYLPQTLAKTKKTKSSLKKTVAFADEGNSNSDTDKIMARMDAMTLKIDAQYKELQTHSKKLNPILMKMIYLCPMKRKLNSCKLFRKTVSVDAIEEILGGKIFPTSLLDECSKDSSIPSKQPLLRRNLWLEFDEFMAMTADETP